MAAPEPPATSSVAGKDVLVLRVTASRLELEQAEALSRLLLEEKSAFAKVLLNLAGVSYISSTGVSLLVRIATEKALKIVNVSAKVSQVLQSIGILSFLKIYRSEREALDAFEAAADKPAGPSGRKPSQH